MRILPALLSLVLVAAAAEENPIQKMLGVVEMGKPLVGKTVILFPLRTKAAPPAANFIPCTRCDSLKFSEPDMPKRRYNLLVTNSGGKPVMLPGGTVLEGGHIDRLIRNDHLVGPGATIEIRTLPAASSGDWRKEPAPFHVHRAMAPIYLRAKADFGGTRSLVSSFVSKWIDFRDEGDKRRSLASILSSQVLKEFALQDRKKAGVVPDVLKDDRLVGSISAVRGRVQSLVLYATNDVALAHLFPLVEGAAVSNAAIVLRARKLGIEVPGDEDPKGTLERLTKEATKLLEQVRKSRYKLDDLTKGEVGQAWLMRTSGGDRGRAVALDGRLAHLVVYPHDPFEAKLYGSKVRAPGDDDDDDSPDGTAETVRRAESGRRLTAHERRFLNRAGRGGGGGAGRGR